MSPRSPLIWCKPFTYLVLAGLILSACAAPATPAASPTTPPAAESPTQPPSAPPTAVPTQAPTAIPTEAPKVGGTFTLVSTFEPDTLDPHKTNLGASSLVCHFLYSSLITWDPEGNYVPYLAKSWEVAPDGLTYTFKLREDVHFTNGEPLTAEDVAWTYQRALDPATASPSTGPNLAHVKTIEASDKYTVKITMKEPFYYLLDTLSIDSYQGILNKKAVEAAGDNYGRNPVGAGPFILKEWLTGDRLVLERNPDFVWGPSFTDGKPSNIQTLVIRIIPENSTIVAGLEAGELDYVGNGAIQPRDVERVVATGKFDDVKILAPALMPYITMNTSKPPFDDVKVRQALNYAADTQAIIDVVVPNTGSVVQRGPLSPTIEGYWPGIEDYGYHFDLEKAKGLMKEAGYTTNADGMLVKDGKPLTFTVNLITGFDVLNKSTEMLQAQWQALGVDVKLEQLDPGVAIQKMAKGDYEAAVMGYGWPNSEMLNMLFNSAQIGSNNFSFVKDAQLDDILNKMMTSPEKTEHLKWAAEAQKRIVDMAYVVPLFAQNGDDLVTKRLKDYTDKLPLGLEIFDAWLAQ